MAAVAVLNAVAYIEVDGRHYMNPDETDALRCWTDHFRETLLLKPRLHTDRIPDGWKPLPGNVSADPLYTMAPGALPSMPARIRGTRAAARRAAGRVGLAYLRAPNWEACFVQEIFQRAGTPVLLELFGDFEETILTEWEGHPVKRWVRHPVARWADRRTRRMADTAETLGCMGEALKVKYATRREATVTTAHLVPERAFRAREDTCLGDELRLLFVGVLSPRKGVSHLIDAVAQIVSRGRRVRLDLVGDGPSQGELEQQVTAASLGKQVVFHGRVSHGAKLLDFFRSADVMVLPSVGAEGLPRVIQEAMASSCPVVATDIGSVRYQLGHGAFGAVVPPGDADALAAAILRIADDAEYRRALIAKAYAEAQNHSFERQWLQVRDLLRTHVNPSLLADSGPPPALD